MSCPDHLTHPETWQGDAGDVVAALGRTYTFGTHPDRPWLLGNPDYWLGPRVGARDYLADYLALGGVTITGEWRDGEYTTRVTWE